MVKRNYGNTGNKWNLEMKLANLFQFIYNRIEHETKSNFISVIFINCRAFPGLVIFSFLQEKLKQNQFKLAEKVKKNNLDLCNASTDKNG